MFKNLSLKVILFGFIFTFFSSFGQSFFLGLFNTSIRDALSITHGQFGSIYASATLMSSIVLVWIGKKIDDVNILKFASYVIIFLSVSCFVFSKISSVIFLSLEKLNKNFLPNQFWLRMLLVIDLETAPKKKTPIITQIILSKAIAGEKPWPELIISVSGSKGSKFKLINNINYKGLNKWKIKTYKRNNQNHHIN